MASTSAGIAIANPHHWYLNVFVNELPRRSISYIVFFYLFKSYFEMFDDSNLNHKQLKEEFQEMETRCEGTASHNYADSINEEFRVHDSISILDQLPQEPPMPAPAVGMRLYHWPDTSRKHKEEIRTEEHNTFFP